jgi:hypothetical protein
MRFATYYKNFATWHTVFFFASIYPNSDVGFVGWRGEGFMIAFWCAVEMSTQEELRL